MKYPIRIKIRPIIEKYYFNGFKKIIFAKINYLSLFLQIYKVESQNFLDPVLAKP